MKARGFESPLQLQMLLEQKEKQSATKNYRMEDATNNEWIYSETKL
jgi:hypothetical protein